MANLPNPWPWGPFVLDQNVSPNVVYFPKEEGENKSEGSAAGNSLGTWDGNNFYLNPYLVQLTVNVPNGVAGLDSNGKILTSNYNFASTSTAQAGADTTKPVNAAGVAAAAQLAAFFQSFNG